MTAGWLAAVVALAAAVAWANGANDVSKGVATLVGSGVAKRKAAVAWGVVWTLAGSLGAAAASQSLVATFSGKGFLGSPETRSAFLCAVAAGAFAWVAFASWKGLPVSTTHAITGALAGAGIAAQGASSLRWGFLVQKVALPLALSPLISVAAVSAVYPLLRRSVRVFETYCLCIERRELAPAEAPVAMQSIAVPAAVVASAAECESSPAVTARVTAVDALHWLSAAATSFARGLNDTPKIVALGAGAAVVSGVTSFSLYAAIALAMAIGGLVAGFRVVDTLACRVTPMAPGEGFAANLVTTVLVGTASFVALPVSTTHVSTGAIVGVGLHHGSRIQWRTVRDMAFAWIVTLPVAAAVAAAAFVLFGRA